MIKVRQIVDGKEESIELDDTGTVGDAIDKTHKVEHGFVCASEQDVMSIDGKSNDHCKNTWWMISVNGNTMECSVHTFLKDNDVIEWKYVDCNLTTCAKCGKEFTCEISLGKHHCWCMDKPPVIPDKTLKGCVCEECLAKMPRA